jgi:peptide/nickel transport system substrate-binding protein
MKLQRLLVIAAAGLAFAVGCAPTAGPTASSAPAAHEQRAENQTIRIAFSFVYATMSPDVASGWPYMGVPMYDTLARYGAGYTVTPSVATKWDLSADGLTWTFTLRDDVKFWNGDPLTAEDVAFTLNSAMQRNWPARSFFANVTEAIARNATTVDVKTRVVDVTVPNGAPMLWIVPKKYYESVGIDGFKTKPMGSGPYDLVDFVSGQKIVYAKRSQPHAFRTPIADRLEITAIVDAAQKINGIRTDALDFSHMLLNAEQLDLAQRQDLQLKRLESDTAIVALIPLGSAAARNSPLRDKRVRQALNYAVDKETLARTALRGSHDASGQIATPASQSWDPNVKAWPFDPAMAKRLLAEAGYPNGFKASMDFTAAALAKEIVLAIQANLKDVGVEVDIRELEATTFVDAANARNNQVRGDLFPTTFSDNNGFFSGSRGLLGCNRPQPNRPDTEFYCNPEWDRAFDAAFQERDAAKRKELYLKMNQLMREDVAGIFVAVRSSYVVQAPKLRGFEAFVPNYFILDSVYKVR